MSYVLQSTKWSSTAVDPDIQSLIAGFYELADEKSPDAGPRLAHEIFAPSGKLAGSTNTFNGREEISKSRDNAWGKVIARRHQVLQVFTNDPDGHNLMILGVVKMTLWNGQSLEMQFASRFVVDDNSLEGNNPRLSLVQVFADSSPLVAALKDA
ncbi:hypothetical protein BJY01DRAFT_208821 [Aspergillus pseudoustus]|uniref:SnoaL-like domain-containing protein n=1 Tax=Aspergillus pseudoustus TaxID=1810923 RepID=A0ABR4KI16_9EURO